MRLTWLKFRREFASEWLSFQNESTAGAQEVKRTSENASPSTAAGKVSAAAAAASDEQVVHQHAFQLDRGRLRSRRYHGLLIHFEN